MARSGALWKMRRVSLSLRRAWARRAWCLAGLLGLMALSLWTGGGVLAAEPGDGGYAVRLYGPLAQLPAGHWAYKALEDLMQAGLVVEYTPGLFDVDRVITRYEAALLLVDAFRRADAVTAEAQGPARLRTLLPERLVAAGVSGADAGARLMETVRALGKEFAEELKVLGFAMEGVVQPSGLEVAASGTLRVRSSASRLPASESARLPSASAGAEGASAAEAGPPAMTEEAGATDLAPPEPQAVGVDETPGIAAGLTLPRVGLQASPAAVASEYELGIRLALPSRWDVDGQVDLATLTPTELGLLVAGPDPDRWLWARVGSVVSPLGASLGLGATDEPLTLQGIEARLLGGDARTGIVVGEPVPTVPLMGEDGRGKTVAVLDGSLVLSRQVVVGGAVIRTSDDRTALLELGEGATVTSLSGRVALLPWLSITGEYAQNLWALPLVGSAMRLGATLQLGDVTLGARVGRISPEFRPALGAVRPGDEVGVDATVDLGDIRLRAGTGRRHVVSETGVPRPEQTTSFGVRIGWLAGATVAADYELISVEDLEAGRDLARTRLGVGLETPAAQVQMGLEWGPREPYHATIEDRHLEASASVSYRLNPYSAVMLGYRLIDFGQDAGREAGATAQITVRF